VKRSGCARPIMNASHVVLPLVFGAFGSVLGRRRGLLGDGGRARHRQLDRPAGICDQRPRSDEGQDPIVPDAPAEAMPGRLSEGAAGGFDRRLRSRDWDGVEAGMGIRLRLADLESGSRNSTGACWHASTATTAGSVCGAASTAARWTVPGSGRRAGSRRLLRRCRLPRSDRPMCRAEFERLWQREMLLASYTPRWLTAAWSTVRRRGHWPSSCDRVRRITPES
jgi:hypothetical protein